MISWLLVFGVTALTPVMKTPKEIVLISGFESFNLPLYEKSATMVDRDVRIRCFSDRDIASQRKEVADALANADAFVGSLLFDYDDCEWLKPRVEQIETRLVFESATELMALNQVGSFKMDGGGPPPAVKAVLSKFGSNREEDKLQGYLKLLKVGPQLLKLVPGDKASDVRSWLTLYRYWNEGGQKNVASMFRVLYDRLASDTAVEEPEVVEFPLVGLVHPDSDRVFKTPREYLEWRKPPQDAPRVAVLLFRKHVVTEQPYIPQLIRELETEGLAPLPIFITGVEAHTVVRDLLTTTAEIINEKKGVFFRPRTYDRRGAARVDAIVNAIGFPLVGGPAGSMQAGRDTAVAEDLLTSMDVPYVVAAPLLLQEISQWRESGVTGLQSVVLYALPELDGAIDAVVLGGLEGDTVALVPERVRKLASRLKRRIALKAKKQHKKTAVVLYGYPPNIGAVGTAALLNVPKSLDMLFEALAPKQLPADKNLGEAVVAALAFLSTAPIVNNYQSAEAELVNVARRARDGDERVASALAGLLQGDELAPGIRVVSDGVMRDDLELSKYMRCELDNCWPEKKLAPGVAKDGSLVVNGIELYGEIFVAVQPLLGFEGDPMALLFGGNQGPGERLTPHAQYVAFYERLNRDYDACVHLGTHGTVEWLPGQSLGNDEKSWSDRLLDLPNFYVYAANNPSESILAKRRGYATLVSYGTPPYGRSGLYLELVSLKDLLDDYFSNPSSDLENNILETVERTGLRSDVPSFEPFQDYAFKLNSYLAELQNRLFSSGLHVFGVKPSRDEVRAYLDAYLDADETKLADLALRSYDARPIVPQWPPEKDTRPWEAVEIAKRLGKSTDELDNLLNGLAGGYIPPGVGGDLLRDGVGALPTGRNIHALDPYRMPSAGAWARGQIIADRILEQHRAANDGAYPETVAVALWGLDTIKTRGESVAIAVALAGGVPVREGTGRIVRFDLVPLEELGRPRIDVLATLSGIFRDSFENVILLLDDFFERCAAADEPARSNFVRKHVLASDDSLEKPAARLFSNPPGDYGSLVNDAVVSGEWEQNAQLGDTWAARNAFSYGRDGPADQPELLDSLLATTDRVVQEIDSVEYGLTDVQEIYANTGALAVAAQDRRERIAGKKNKLAVSIVEAFDSKEDPKPRDLEETLRLEYRSKLLNPKWANAMVAQGAGGAFEISQRMTSALGWAATTGLDDFVFDQAAERYALDEDMAHELRRLNPEAYKNVLGRLLEANARGLWDADPSTLDKLKDMYGDADDRVEGLV